MEEEKKLADLHQVFGQLEDETKEQVLLAARCLMTAQGILRKDSVKASFVLLAKNIPPMESEKQTLV